MKFFTVSAFFAMIVSVLAGTISTTPEESVKWLSVETGVLESGNNTVTKRRPGPNAEVLTCYNIGTAVNRSPMISVIDDWCGVIGTQVNDGQTIFARYDYGTFTVLVSIEAINGCSFTVDNRCDRLLKRPVNQCNPDQVNGKQGGFVTDVCSQWRTDPGSNGSDF